MWIFAYICLCIVVAYAISRFESLTRRKVTERMNLECSKLDDIQVVLVGPSKPDAEALSDTLLSIIQNAKCPKNFKVTILEAVDSFEKESTTLLRYKDKCISRGTFTNTFLDQVVLHQVLSGSSMIHELKYILPIDSRLTMMTTTDIQFVSNWDQDILQSFSSLPFHASGLYCGCAPSLDGSNVSAYTSVETFVKKSPIIVSRPLLREALPSRVIWADWPLLMETSRLRSELHALQAGDPETFALQLTHLLGDTFYSYRSCVGTRIKPWPVVSNYMLFANPSFHAPDKLLGIDESNTSPSEILTKFGSIKNFQWALHR